MTPKEVLQRDAWLQRMPAGSDFLLAMYSSVTDAITTDAALMLVPVDDHLVHRGDGVFESFKCVNGRLYNLPDHLDRLARSAGRLGMTLRFSAEELTDIIVQTVYAAGERNALVRLLLSRGCGTMGVDPYACRREELYVVVYRSAAAGDLHFPAGASVAISRVPVKPGFLATVKTCNYIPNVLMKKEAVDLGVDFTVSLDESGMLAEGATESVGVVTASGCLWMPPPERVLEGTTARRALALAERLVGEGLLKEARYHPIAPQEARSAREMHIYGTTPNITPVTRFDGAPVADGRPGPVAKRLFEMLRDEMLPESIHLTPVFEDE